MSSGSFLSEWDCLFEKKGVITSSTTRMLMFFKHWKLLLFCLSCCCWHMWPRPLTFEQTTLNIVLQFKSSQIMFPFTFLQASICHTTEGVMITAVSKTSFYVLMLWGESQEHLYLWNTSKQIKQPWFLSCCITVAGNKLKHKRNSIQWRPLQFCHSVEMTVIMDNMNVVLDTNTEICLSTLKHENKLSIFALSGIDGPILYLIVLLRRSYIYRSH